MVQSFVTMFHCSFPLIIQNYLQILISVPCTLPNRQSSIDSATLDTITVECARSSECTLPLSILVRARNIHKFIWLDLCYGVNCTENFLGDFF